MLEKLLQSAELKGKWKESAIKRSGRFENKALENLQDKGVPCTKTQIKYQFPLCIHDYGMSYP